MRTPFLTTRGFSSDLPSIFQQMDRMFDEFTVPAASAYDERDFAPSTEIAETEGHYLLSMDLPGMKQNDIKIEVAENRLTVSGERKREQKAENQKIQRYEKSYGFFKRSFTLPNTISAEKIEALYENGVLELYLPKSEASQARTIQVQTKKDGFFDKLLSPKKSETKEGDTAKS